MLRAGAADHRAGRSCRIGSVPTTIAGGLDVDDRRIHACATDARPERLVTANDHERDTDASQSRDDLLGRIHELQTRLDERERQLAEVLQVSARNEHEAVQRLAVAQSELSDQLSDLRFYIRAWDRRYATRAIWLWDGATKRVAHYAAPVGTLRGQTLGYAGVTASMAVGAAAKLLRRTAVAVVSRGDSPGATATVKSQAESEAQSMATGYRCTDDAEPPLISVILPVFNALRWDADYLVEALRSVAAQTYGVFELIIVDDGSTDGSAAVVQQFIDEHPELAITFLRKENGGQSSARNLGAAHARGDWIAFLDQDDLWFPERLETVIPLLAPEVGLVYTDADTIDENGQLERAAIHMQHGAGGKQPKVCIEDALFEDVFVVPGVMTMRKDLFERIGGFDERLSGYEDDDLFLRTIQAGCRIDYVPVATLRWRMYGANYSRSRRMVDSRLYYWRKLVRDYADEGSDKTLARRITLRFFREFLTQCAMMLDEGGPLSADNLEAALELLPDLGAVDRGAFRLSEWAWRSRSRPAYYARWWFLRGLQSTQS